MTVSVREVSPTDPMLRPVVLAHLEHAFAATPHSSCYVMDPDALASEPGLRTWIADRDGTAVGCGALKPLAGGVAEVKSVHVLSSGRRQGVGRAIMHSILAAARDAGQTAVLLETGNSNLPAYGAARAMYERLGFVYCGPFGDYAPDPNSVFMRRDL